MALQQEIEQLQNVKKQLNTQEFKVLECDSDWESEVSLDELYSNDYDLKVDKARLS